MNWVTQSQLCRKWWLCLRACPCYTTLCGCRTLVQFNKNPYHDTTRVILWLSCVVWRYVNTGVQRTYIASICLEPTGESHKYNICNLQSSYVLNKDVPNIDDRVTRYIPPFLKYICCYWAHHLQDVPYSQELCCRLRSFAHKQLLFWFEVLSLTNTFNDTVGPALLFAIQWVGVSTMC